MKIYLLFLFIFVSCSLFHEKEPTLPDNLEQAVSSSLRTDENTDRDDYQHPLETLQFFGITPTMTVAEVSPGAGYYTEILAPYLAKGGQYLIIASRMPSRPPQFMLENELKLQNILLRYKAVQAKARIVPFEPLNKRSATQAESVDMILSFSHVHNWVAQGKTKETFKLFHDLLKPNGVLGIVQHRIPYGQKNYSRSGYMTEKEVVALVEKFGFKLQSRSEVNSNPRDKQNYPKGVWVLPPTYRLGDKDRDVYEDIGESDKMTLKFVKK